MKNSVKSLIVTLRVSGLTDGLVVEKEFDLVMSRDDLIDGAAPLSAKIANEVESHMLGALAGLRLVPA